MATETTNTETTETAAIDTTEAQGKQPSVAESLSAAWDATVAKQEAQGGDKGAGERVRDGSGKFVKKDEPAARTDDAATTATAAAAQAERFGIKRPDSWKKELWPIWDKLDAGQPLTREEQKQFLEYIPHRETEYQKGVSTYKTEWDRAKPLIDAVAPYQPFLQQANLKPEQFVAALAQSDQALRYGTPQQKMETFIRLAQDYQVPLQELFVKGEDGQVYFNQNYLRQHAQQAQPSQTGLTKQDVAMMLAQERLVASVQQFQTAKDKDGSLLYPHFNEVKQTMDGLLRSGLATDLQGAYDAALRMPQHQALYEAQQTAKRDAEAAAKKAEEAATAERARLKTVSTRTSTPAGPVNTPKGNGREAIANALSEAYDRHVGGRI